MYLIEIDTEKFDFQGISHEEYLEFLAIGAYEKKRKFIYGNTTGNHTSSSKSPLSKRQRKILVLSS